jgi:hypothetical protein
MDAAWLMLSGFFSLLGFAVFTYGRKQRTATHTLVGIALMVYPYFVSSPYALVGIGVLLLVGIVVGNRIESE